MKTNLINALNEELRKSDYAIKTGHYESVAGFCESNKLDSDDIERQNKNIEEFKKALAYLINDDTSGFESLDMIAQGEYVFDNSTAMLAGEYLSEIGL